jgi:hypothetical protein
MGKKTCCPFIIEYNTLGMSFEICEASQFFYNKIYISQNSVITFMGSPFEGNKR